MIEASMRNGRLLSLKAPCINQPVKVGGLVEIWDFPKIWVPYFGVLFRKSPILCSLFLSDTAVEDQGNPTFGDLGIVGLSCHPPVTSIADSLVFIYIYIYIFIFICLFIYLSPHKEAGF